MIRLRCHAAFLAAASILVLALAGCATAPSGQRAAPTSFVPHSYWGTGDRSRGAVDSVAVLPAESPKDMLPLIQPATLAAFVDTAPLSTAGFFDALGRIAPRLTAVHPLRIRYWSADALGRPVLLSGLIYLPDAAPGTHRAVPLLAVCHGTQALRDRVPSRLAGAERLIGQLAASSGLAVAMPDYPGLGDGEGFHTYCHADSLAHATVDLLRALRFLMASEWARGAWVEDGRTYVAGYSEGGSAAMAALRELVVDLPGEFRVTRAFPMAGAFDMSGTMRRLMVGDLPIPQPYYLPYTVLGWRDAHAAEGFDVSRIIRREWLDALAPLFDARTSGRSVNDRIAELQGAASGQAVPSRMLTEETRAALLDPEASDWGRTLLAVLKANDLADWPCPPGVFVHFMATPRDELVPWENSRIAYAAFKARGADVSFDELAQSGHERGGYEGYARTLVRIWKDLRLIE